MSLKEKFIKETEGKTDFEVLVTLVKLPTGAIEVITNSKNIDTKVEYLKTTYDENFELVHNKNVKIVGYTFY